MNIGFPNAAVDRIVPLQKAWWSIVGISRRVQGMGCWWKSNEDPSLTEETVHYAPDLEPYIERKLFSVNTGHATVYTGKALGYETIGEAIKDEKVLTQLNMVKKFVTIIS